MDERLIKSLATREILTPFPIQEKTLPDTLAGRDVLGRGKTGSGKTLAFSIPLVTRLAGMQRRGRPSALVLAPTRELATQIAATLEPLAAALNLKVTTIFGGVLQNRQEAALHSGVDKLVKRFLRNPVTHSIDEAHSPVPQMTHHVFHVAGVQAKKELVHHLASGTGRRILFMRTKHQAKKLAKQLTDAGVPSVDLHGNLSQPARDRNLAAFSSGDARVLVATDIAARGVHVDEVGLVVHVDPPMEHKAYLHRSGRTARAGNSGDVVTVVLPEQRRDTQALMRKAGINVRPQEVIAHSAPVTALVGDIAPLRKPAPRDNPAPKATPPKAGGSRRRRPGSQSGAVRSHSRNHSGRRSRSDKPAAKQ